MFKKCSIAAHLLDCIGDEGVPEIWEDPVAKEEGAICFFACPVGFSSFCDEGGGGGVRGGEGRGVRDDIPKIRH